MFKIYDGREHFYQWDADRKLIVEDPSIVEVHFCNRTDNCSLVCETYVEDGVTLVNVPNILLQTNWCIRVYAFDGKHTKHEERYDVIARTKPADYIYTETELKNYRELEERLDEIEKNGISDETVAKAVETYLEENDIQVDLTGYATETYVDEAIANLDVDVDLTDYYTKKQTDDLIDAIELTPGEKGEPGKDGKNGADGISATHTWYGTTLSITSASGTSSADLKGAPGKDGVDGKDYVLTAADKQEIAGMVEVTGGGAAERVDITCDASAEASGTDLNVALGLKQIYNQISGTQLPNLSNYYINGSAIIEGSVSIDGSTPTMKLHIIDAPGIVKTFLYPVVSGSTVNYNAYEVTNSGFATTTYVETAITNTLGVIENGTY